MTEDQAQLILDVCNLLIDGPEQGLDGAYQTYGNGVKCLFCERPLMQEKNTLGHKALCPMQKVHRLKYWADNAERETA